MNEAIVHQLQLLQQNVESLVSQKNILQEQLFELDSALKSLPGSPKSYKIVGKLLINKDVVTLVAELNIEKQNLELQMQEIELQENSVQEKMQKLQQELVAQKKGE